MRVCVVIVNFNGYLDTIECLESLLKLTYKQFCILIVDNSDNENSIRHFQEWANGAVHVVSTNFPEIIYPLAPKPIMINVSELEQIGALSFDGSIFIIKATNNGFAAANNLIMDAKLSEVDYFWLLNNDTIVDRDSLSHLVNFSCQAKSNVGIIGSKLFQYHNPLNLQGVGGYYNRWFGIVRELGFNTKDSGQWDKRKFNFDYVIGASMFVKKEFIEDVGLMDSDLFLYYEEIDWAIRGRNKNWDLAFCCESKVYHKMGSSINTSNGKGNSVLADFYSIRNRVLVAKKHLPISLLTLYPAFFMFMVNRIILGQFSRILMMFRIVFNPKGHYNNRIK